MTPLAQAFARRIAATGPITLAEYMADCLMHPEHGYYATRDPLGRSGDFTTAPEVSQIFGEVIGLALAQAWIDQGRPDPVALAELGPGRGTLMADALRAMGAVPGLRQAVQIHLVEASPALRAVQAATLADAAPTWHDHVDTLPDDRPLFVVANEFFDALPIRQFVRDGGMWRERQVGLTDGALALGLSMPAPVAALDDRLDDTDDGTIVETCAAAIPIVQALATRIATQGGAGLIVDYGGWRSRGDTFQAVRGHAATDPLAAPGHADLTAHVDFEPLATAAWQAGAAVSDLTHQGVFLERLGITERARALARGLSEQALDAHVAAHRRLTHPNEMGSIFQCLGLTPRGANPVPGTSP